MEQGRQLQAPHEDELEKIEQIKDRSDLTGIYRTGQQQFEGELMSKDTRDKAKAEELEAITSGLGRYAFVIGLLLVYPFIAGALLATGLYIATQYLMRDNAMVLVFTSIALLAFWLITSYKAYAWIYKKFYTHALRAGPFVTVMLISLIMASQALYGIITETIGGQSLLRTVVVICSLLLIYSLLGSFVLVGIWGNSKLKSGTKVLVSGVVLIFSAFFVVSTYLF